MIQELSKLHAYPRVIAPINFMVIDVYKCFLYIIQLFIKSIQVRPPVPVHTFCTFHTHPVGLINTCYSESEAQALEQATLSCYPNLRLYDEFGINAQSLEGEILKSVMYQGALEDKVVLPIHDAVAVKAQDAEWAAERMEAAWVQVCCKKGNAARPRIKIVSTSASEK